MDENLINYYTLGKHIKAARKARHITQEMLAEKMNVSIGHVGKIERGDRLINLERLAQICLILQVPIEDMIAGCVDKELDDIPVINALTQERSTHTTRFSKASPERSRTWSRKLCMTSSRG